MAGALPDYVMSDYRMTVRFAIFLKVAEAYATEPFEKSFLAILVFRRSVRVLYNGHLCWQYSRRLYNETPQPQFRGVGSLIFRCAAPSAADLLTSGIVIDYGIRMLSSHTIRRSHLS